MKEELITGVMQQMLPYLDNAQLKQLKQVLEQLLFHYKVTDVEVKKAEDDSGELMAMFIATKRIEGCSEKTLKYYQTMIGAMITFLGKNVRRILTEGLPQNGCSGSWRENAMSKLLSYETIVKAHEGVPDAIDTVLSHYI